jgi:hypothetical protein
MAKVKKTVKKAQGGGNYQTMGDATKVSPKKSKYVSEDGNYKLKFKGDDNSKPAEDTFKTSLVQRRTLKGFLKGAPKAAGKMKLKPGGKVMMKRADGSVSQRGLWDNIRSKAAKNKATGAKPKSPSKAMLSQEKKIKAKGK